MGRRKGFPGSIILILGAREACVAATNSFSFKQIIPKVQTPGRCGIVAISVKPHKGSFREGCISYLGNCHSNSSTSKRLGQHGGAERAGETHVLDPRGVEQGQHRRGSKPSAVNRLSSASPAASNEAPS